MYFVSPCNSARDVGIRPGDCAARNEFHTEQKKFHRRHPVLRSERACPTPSWQPDARVQYMRSRLVSYCLRHVVAPIQACSRGGFAAAAKLVVEEAAASQKMACGSPRPRSVAVPVGVGIRDGTRDGRAKPPARGAKRRPNLETRTLNDGIPYYGQFGRRAVAETCPCCWSRGPHALGAARARELRSCLLVASTALDPVETYRRLRGVVGGGRMDMLASVDAEPYSL